MGLEIALREVDRGDDIPAVLGVAVDRPLGYAWLLQGVGQLDLAGHLAQVAVAEDDHRVAVLEAELEGQDGEVQHLLGGGGRQHDGLRVAMAQAVAGQLDVGLLGGDVAQAGPAAHDVHKDAWQLRADHVGDALQHQAEARRGGEGHGGQARAGGAIHHVHGGDFADGLEEGAIQLGQEPGHELGALGGGGDGVAVDVAAAGQDGADGRGIGALDDQWLGGGQGQHLGGDVHGLRGIAGPHAEELGWVLQLKLLVGALFGRAQAVGFRAGIHAQTARIAVGQVEHHGYQAREGIHLVAEGDAVLGTGINAAAAAFAIFRQEKWLRPFFEGHVTSAAGTFPLLPRSVVPGPCAWDHKRLITQTTADQWAQKSSLGGQSVGVYRSPQCSFCWRRAKKSRPGRWRRVICAAPWQRRTSSPGSTRNPT